MHIKIILYGYPQPKVMKSQEISCMGRLKIFLSKGQKTVRIIGLGLDIYRGNPPLTVASHLYLYIVYIKYIHIHKIVLLALG